MDDRAALIARRVALAASGWMNAPADYEAYRRMAVAVAEWNDYTSPSLSGQSDTGSAEQDDEDDEELVDVDQLPPPMALAEGIAELEDTLRRMARQVL